jgi:hypothetical protein
MKDKTPIWITLAFLAFATILNFFFVHQLSEERRMHRITMDLLIKCNEPPTMPAPPDFSEDTVSYDPMVFTNCYFRWSDDAVTYNYSDSVSDIKFVDATPWWYGKSPALHYFWGPRTSSYHFDRGMGYRTKHPIKGWDIFQYNIPSPFSERLRLNILRDKRPPPAHIVKIDSCHFEVNGVQYNLNKIYRVNRWRDLMLVPLWVPVECHNYHPMLPFEEHDFVYLSSNGRMRCYSYYTEQPLPHYDDCQKLQISMNTTFN